MSRTTGPGFTFNGKSSDAMGVRLMRYPTIPQPSRRGKPETIPGRSGTLWMDDNDNYDDIEITMECRTVNGADRNAINAWLTGFGDLVFAANPSYAYRARIVKGFDPERFMPGCDAVQFQLKVSCEPFRYQASPGEPISRDVGGLIANPGTIYSRPIITVYGNGDINLMIGTEIMMISGVSGSIVIDCEAETAYQPGSPNILKTGNITLVGGSWPVFNTGSVMFQWTGSVSKVEIQPQWRWI